MVELSAGVRLFGTRGRLLSIIATVVQGYGSSVSLPEVKMARKWNIENSLLHFHAEVQQEIAVERIF
jgi:hypothetical protein